MTALTYRLMQILMSPKQYLLGPGDPSDYAMAYGNAAYSLVGPTARQANH